ncbi:MAG: putative multicomponent Na+:H+ antiporter subunit [Eubacteriaceae bacterium]|jgi:uncharacterized MnhB-related membrane protein|nr:putative multicomponent Na+:H+ antiporter subunit [Eubacteriaceae bacterium]
MTEKIFLIGLIILAIFAVNTRHLRRAIIYLGIFSLVSSLVYLFYGSPDVAIAEAVIGSTITTVLFLVSFKKSRVFIIYYANADFNSSDSRKTIKARGQILKSIEKFLIDHEFEPQLIMTTKSYELILSSEVFDLLVYQDNSQLLITGPDEYHLDGIETFLKDKSFKDLEICFGRCVEYEEFRS